MSGISDHATCQTEGCDAIIPPDAAMCERCGMKETIRLQVLKIEELEAEVVMWKARVLV